MRLLAAAAVVALLLQLLIVPSRFSEAELRERFTIDLETTHTVFGTAAAVWICQRAEAWHLALTSGIPLFDAGTDPPQAVHGAVSASLHALHDRMMGNSYFRAIDALLRLACLRLSILAHCWTGIAFLAGAALLDGWTSRRLRRVLVLPDRPERFASATMASVACAWAVLALAGAPGATPPGTLLAVASLGALLLRWVLAWHHGGRT